MSDGVFFVKIDQPKTTEVLDFLIHNGTEIVLKLKNQHYKSKILARLTPTLFSIYKFTLISFEDEEILCSFEIKNEKYFFKTYLKTTPTDFKIQVPAEVFQLQRRNDFRVSIPTGVTYICEIKRVNYRKAPLKVELRDLSLGGCMISFRSSDLQLKMDDEVDLELKMNQFEMESISCITKHIKKIDASSITMIGLKFIEPDAAFLTDLQGLLVYLDRVRRGKGYD